MQTEQRHRHSHQHHSHQGCHEGNYGQGQYSQSQPSQSQFSQSQGPEMFYGYCHETGRMRMMNYPDYLSNTQTAYSNLYSGMTSTLQPYTDVMQGRTSNRPKHRHEDCGCHHGHDCHCECCIRCADAVEYARCGEVRQIPVTFENDTRRERDVKLQLGDFASESGQQLGWKATLSETEFKLPPCGHKTVLLTVPVDCGRSGTTGNPNSTDSQTPPIATVDSCKVAYATLRAEGCLVRPLVIAVAVLPNDCGAHVAGCQCGCC